MSVCKHRGVSLETLYAFINHAKARTSGFRVCMHILLASPHFSEHWRWHIQDGKKKMNDQLVTANWNPKALLIGLLDSSFLAPGGVWHYAWLSMSNCQSYILNKYRITRVINWWLNFNYWVNYLFELMRKAPTFIYFYWDKSQMLIVFAKL